MEPAGPVIQLVQWISAPISRCWKYHRGLKENAETLKQEMDKLNSRKKDILSRLDTEVIQGETKSKDEVQNWLQRVEKIGDEINTINEKVETVKCCSRAGIGKNVLQKIQEVEKLYKNGEFPQGLVIQLPRQTGLILPTPNLGEQTTSRRKMEEIWELLMDDDVKRIGLYGMGGMGKTTVMKHINNRLQEKKEKFDDVVWVTVSKASNIIKLQHAIACQINVDISNDDDVTIRAGKLHAKLSEKERYVLILDDVWDVYELHDVGIPQPSSQNGSKLVLTTRLLNVCLRMNCKAIPMEALSDMEAWNLFLDTVGRDVLSNPNMEAIVNSVVKECACLPLAIVTIAGSLRGIVDYDDWKTALEDLKTNTKGNNEIFEKLKFSYDRLRDKNLQTCLLYCALFPEDYAIERDILIEYLIVEEIIKGRNRQAELERGRTMLNELIRACLLEDTKDKYRRKCVKMHDLIRDMALQITIDKPRFLVEAGMGLKCVPDEENWKEDLVRVSLMHNTISNIPSSFEAPKCPTLSTLLLNSNPLTSISKNFFLHMKGLSVLDLSDSSIENLPESISELVNLTALLLQRCSRLAYVPSLAKLTALKKLDFYESQMMQIPQGIENLSELRYLRFGFCDVGIIPDGILCKLSKLQYLSLSPGCEVKRRSVELVHLRKLESLYWALYDVESFNAYVRSLAEEGPANYLLQLGHGSFCEDKLNIGVCKVVRLCGYDNVTASVATGGDCPPLLPQDVEILALDKCCINSSSLCELASFENVMNLRVCHLWDCKQLKHLFLYSSSIIPLLQKLEELYLHKVSDLQGLIRRESMASSPLPPGTFSSLKILKVWGCGNIKRLSINAPLPNLEEIIVRRCKQLVEIISTTSNPNEEEGKEEDEDDEAGESSDQQATIVSLPKLRELFLFQLPKLKSIPVVADHSLHRVTIMCCPKLKRVPCLDREPFRTSLRHLNLDKDLQDLLGSQEWDHPNVKRAAAIGQDAVQIILRNRILRPALQRAVHLGWSSALGQE